MIKNKINIKKILALGIMSLIVVLFTACASTPLPNVKESGRQGGLKIGYPEISDYDKSKIVDNMSPQLERSHFKRYITIDEKRRGNMYFTFYVQNDMLMMREPGQCSKKYPCFPKYSNSESFIKFYNDAIALKHKLHKDLKHKLSTYSYNINTPQKIEQFIKRMNTDVFKIKINFTSAYLKKEILEGFSRSADIKYKVLKKKELIEEFKLSNIKLEEFLANQVVAEVHLDNINYKGFHAKNIYPKKIIVKAGEVNKAIDVKPIDLYNISFDYTPSFYKVKDTMIEASFNKLNPYEYDVSIKNKTDFYLTVKHISIYQEGKVRTFTKKNILPPHSAFLDNEVKIRMPYSQDLINQEKKFGVAIEYQLNGKKKILLDKKKISGYGLR